MKVFYCLFVFITFLCYSFCVEQDEGVYVLTSDNFDSFIAENDFVLVEFYAPWCGHCKRLAPEYALAAQELASANANAKLAKVDATEHPELGQAYGVQGYPTLYWFAKEAGSIPSPYSGPREAPGIVNWISKQISNELSVIASQSELSSVLENAPEAVVILYGESDGYSSLVSMNRASQDVAYAHINDVNEFGDFKNGDIVIYPTHKEPLSTQFSNNEELQEFVNNNAYAPVSEFTNASFRRASSNQHVVIGVDDFQNKEKKDNLQNILTQVSEKTEGIAFLFGDSNQLQRGVEGAGASGKVFPTLVAINTVEQSQLVWDEDLEFNVENVEKWANGLKDGSTKPFKKSEAIPEDDGSSSVKTLVAKNFDSISGKNALVEYYAPWCGHCKSLAPIYEELGDFYKGKDVIIAKIDATANYVDAPIKGFPTLIWHAADGSTQLYEGERDINSLVKFVGDKLAHSHDEL